MKQLSLIPNNKCSARPVSKVETFFEMLQLEKQGQEAFIRNSASFVYKSRKLKNYNLVVFGLVFICQKDMFQ